MPKSLKATSAYDRIDDVTTRLRELREDESYSRSVLSGYTKLHLERLNTVIAEPYLHKLTEAFAHYADDHRRATTLIKRSRKKFLRELSLLDKLVKKGIPTTAKLTTRATQALLAGDMQAYHQALAMGARFTKSKLASLFARALPKVKSLRDPLLGRVLLLKKLIRTENASFEFNDFDIELCHAIFRINRSDLVPIVPISVYFSYRGHKWPTPPSDEAFADALLRHGLDKYISEHSNNWPSHLMSQLFSYSPTVIGHLYRNSKILAPWCREHPIDLLTWILASLNSAWPTQHLPIFATDAVLRERLTDWSAYQVSTPSFSPRDVIALEFVQTTTQAIFAEPTKTWLEVLPVFRGHFGPIKPPHGEAALVSVLAEKQTGPSAPGDEPLTTGLNLI